MKHIPLVATFAFLMAYDVAFAQPVQPERRYSLPAPLLQDVFNYLQDRPYKEVAPLIARIQQEVAVQNVPPTQPPEAPK